MKLPVMYFLQSLITSCLLRLKVAPWSIFSFLFFLPPPTPRPTLRNPFNLRYALRPDPTPIHTFSLASRNKIQNAFFSRQHASNYLICMQVKGQAVSVDFRICIDPSACQNEQDDGSVPATKKNRGL